MATPLTGLHRISYGTGDSRAGYRNCPSSSRLVEHDGRQTSPNRLAVVTLALVIALYIGACGALSSEPTPTPSATPTATPTPAPPPAPLSASAYILESNSLIARIEGALGEPGLVYVEYWARGAARLRSRTERSQGTGFAVHAVRLRANTSYSFEVFAATAEGGVTVGPGGTFVTGELPEVLKEARFDVLRGRPTFDLTFLEFRQVGFQGFAAIDHAGQVVWYFEAPYEEQPYVMAQKPSGDIVYIAGFQGGTTAMGLVEISPLGEEKDRLVDECSPFGPIHHEVRVLPDGRIMYLSRDVLRPGYGDPPRPQEGDTIGIWDQATDESEIVWNISDFISPADRTVPASNRTLPGNPLWGGCERDRAVQDWSHADSLFMGEDGSVAVALRNLNQVISVAPDFKSIQWRLGGPGSDFTFPDPSDRFYHPHSAELLPSGNVLLFDNGNTRPGNEGGQYSRGLELALNAETMTVSKVWEYRLKPDMYSICCSSVTRLKNGNTLVMFGSNFVDECCRPFLILEVDASGKEVWVVEHLSPLKPNQYRVYPADSIMGERPVPDG